MTLPRPRTRGWSHRVAAVVFPVVAVVATSSVPPGLPRVALGSYGLAMSVMFAVSAVVHLRRWPPDTTELLFRLDHSAIFVAFVGTAVPLALLGLEGWPRVLLLGLELGIAAVGLVVVWWPTPTPQGFANTIFLTLGWLVVPFVPAMAARAEPGFLVWLLGGGLAYTVGAVIVALRRPDPSPRWFGYHEIWHLLVIVGVGAHLAMLLLTLVP